MLNINAFASLKCSTAGFHLLQYMTSTIKKDSMQSLIGLTIL